MKLVYPSLVTLALAAPNPYRTSYNSSPGFVEQAKQKLKENILKNLGDGPEISPKIQKYIQQLSDPDYEINCNQLCREYRAQAIKMEYLRLEEYLENEKREREEAEKLAQQQREEAERMALQKAEAIMEALLNDIASIGTECDANCQKDVERVVNAMEAMGNQPRSNPEPIPNLRPAAQIMQRAFNSQITSPSIQPRSFKRNSELENVDVDGLNAIRDIQLPPTGDIDIYRTAEEALLKKVSAPECDPSCQQRLALIFRELKMLNTIDFRADNVHETVMSHHAHMRAHSNNDDGKKSQTELRIHAHKPASGNDYAYYKFEGNSAGNYHITDENENSDVLVDVFDTDLLGKKPATWDYRFNLVKNTVEQMDATKSFEPLKNAGLAQPGDDLGEGPPPIYALGKIGKQTWVDGLGVDVVFTDEVYKVMNDFYGQKHIGGWDRASG